jgi:hypothetical protein
VLGDAFSEPVSNGVEEQLKKGGMVRLTGSKKFGPRGV